MSELFPLHDELLPMDAHSLKGRQVEVALQQLKALQQDSTAHNVSPCTGLLMLLKYCTPYAQSWAPLLR